MQQVAEHFFLINGIKYKLQTSVDWKTKQILPPKIEQLFPKQEKSKKRKKRDFETVENPLKKVIPIYLEESCESEWKKLLEVSDIMWNVLQFLDVDDLLEMVLVCKGWKQIITSDLNGAWQSAYWNCLGIEDNGENNENSFQSFIEYQKSKALNDNLVESIYYWNDEDNEYGFNDWEGFSENFEKFSPIVHIVQYATIDNCYTIRNNFTIIAYNTQGNGASVKLEGSITCGDDSYTVTINQSKEVLFDSNRKQLRIKTLKKIANKLGISSSSNDNDFWRQLFVILAISPVLSSGHEGNEINYTEIELC